MPKPTPFLPSCQITRGLPWECEIPGGASRGVVIPRFAPAQSGPEHFKWMEVQDLHRQPWLPKPQIRKAFQENMLAEDVSFVIKRERGHNPGCLRPLSSRSHAVLDKYQLGVVCCTFPADAVSRLWHRDVWHLRDSRRKSVTFTRNGEKTVDVKTGTRDKRWKVLHAPALYQQHYPSTHYDMSALSHSH